MKPSLLFSPRTDLPAILVVGLAGLPSITFAVDEVIDGSAIGVPGDHASPWDIDGKLTIGDTGTGTLTIGPGGQVTSITGRLGNAAGSTGNATVSGAGAYWHLTDAANAVGEHGLVVGRAGTGTLAISGGGVVDSDGWVYIGGYNGGTAATTGAGTVTVSGAGSRLEAGLAIILASNVGNTASLTVSEGGAVKSYQGRLQNGSTVMLTGTGTRWDLDIGINVVGAGSLATVKDGAILSSGVGLSSNTGGTFAVKAGGTATFAGTMLHDGNLTVEGGGKIHFTGAGQNIRVGNSGGSVGAVTITGTGSEWTSVSGIAIGASGNRNAISNNTLTIADGGKVTVDGGAGKITLASSNYVNATMNIGNGGAAGIVSASEVTSGTGLNSTATVNFNHTGTTTFAANLTGTRLAVNQTGPGTTILTGTGNSYGMATTVSAGKLVNNSSLGNTAITVMNNGTYGGNGTHIGGITVQSGGAFAPGASIGIMNTGSLHLIGGAIYEWEIGDAAGAAGTGWDTVEVAGAMSFASTEASPFTLTLEKAGALTNFDPLQSYQFLIASAVGGITGFNEDFVTIDASAIPESGTGAWSLGQSGNSLILSYSAVPEPSAALLGALGLLAVVRRRRAC
ncbi:hypothetical protein OKA04_12545 [Luteolibacter flavescens]|uniref:PEP-CTERM sorting domain-containing protein n=1 Tax=Luteolibacter flavescens TaxID=1859460 RepID=A0ABT3FPQ9_9BACT|nr:hypothetical protein [Luteolibacter flavescens]MCW1885560.1 hypothetical protein [Luteolibacter flavescens]